MMPLASEVVPTTAARLASMCGARPMETDSGRRHEHPQATPAADQGIGNVERRGAGNGRGGKIGHRRAERRETGTTGR